MALLGDELGRFECWMWPLALVRDLEPWFHAERLHRGRDLARAVAVQPDHVELEYVGPSFRVIQRLFVARARRAAWMTFDVKTESTLELQVRFTPRIEPMWPAGLGGRLALRDDETGAVALSEELGRFAALLGSPEAEPCDLDADHAVPREPLVVRLPCSVARAARGPLVFFIAGAERAPQLLSDQARVGEHGAARGHARLHAVLESAREEYRWISRHWANEARELEQHWQRFLARTTHLECDDAGHVEAFTWAKVAIEKAWVEVDGLGRGLVAGLAPSGASERPGFGWFFGGDALSASRAMCAYGDFEGARAALEFVASTQRDDGKLMHELVLSAGLCNWEADYPYAFYKAQITPGFIACLHDYFQASGDRESVERLWPRVIEAWNSCKRSLEDDGLLSNRKLGIAALEAGALVGRIRSDIYLHGIWLSALRGLEQLAQALEQSQFAAQVRQERERAQSAAETFWSERAGHYGFAQLVDGSLQDDSTSYQALAVSRRLLDPARSARSSAALNRPALAADWGVRLFADDASIFDAASYNTGTVFPYTTNFAILAQFAHGYTLAGHQLLDSVVALHDFSGLGFVPEHLRADRCETPARGVPHQIFSSSAIGQATVNGVFGLAPSAPASHAELRAQLAPTSARSALRRARVGATTFDVELEREHGAQTTLTVRVRKLKGPRLRLRLRTVLPPLSRAAHVGGRPVPLEPLAGGLDATLEEFDLASEATIRLEHRSGPELLLERLVLREGARSHHLRVCETQFDERSVTWTLWGRAGSTYRIGWRSDLALNFEGARASGERELELEFPSGEAEFSSLRLRARVLEQVATP